MDDKTRTELEAAVYRRLVERLPETVAEGSTTLLEIGADWLPVEAYRIRAAQKAGSARDRPWRSDADARKEKLSEAKVTIGANASTEGKLYGSVGPRDLGSALSSTGLDRARRGAGRRVRGARAGCSESGVRCVECTQRRFRSIHTGHRGSRVSQRSISRSRTRCEVMPRPTASGCRRIRAVIRRYPGMPPIR